MKIKIKVTGEDVDKGEFGDCHSCPIARATARYFGVDSEYVSVGRFHLEVMAKGRLLKARMPLAARVFVRDFDGGEFVRPFVFTADMDRVKERKE